MFPIMSNFGADVVNFWANFRVTLVWHFQSAWIGAGAAAAPDRFVVKIECPTSPTNPRQVKFHTILLYRVAPIALLAVNKAALVVRLVAGCRIAILVRL